MNVRLAAFAEEARRQVGRRKAAFPEAEVRRLIEETGDSGRFRKALQQPGISLIAEFKRRSPSAGQQTGKTLGEVLPAYRNGGAAALSILTEEKHFGGSLEDLRAARSLTALPILRKDFIVDPYQLFESKAAGADGVLLVVGALRPEELSLLHAKALQTGLDALVEVHDERELRTALEIGAAIIGLNSRDLADFSVDLSRIEALLPLVPPGKLTVAESGITDASAVRRLRDLGADAVLVGTSLLRNRSPERAVRDLLEGSVPDGQ